MRLLFDFCMIKAKISPRPTNEFLKTKPLFFRYSVLSSVFPHHTALLSLEQKGCISYATPDGSFGPIVVQNS